MSKIVVALGGNALQKNGEASALAQQRIAKTTVNQLIPLIKDGHELIIVHGNGPQVGNIVLHEEAIDTPSVPTTPLHSCVAMTQGMIGFWLQKALLEELRRAKIKKHAVCIVTQVEVSPQDEAFRNPTKPIGPFYSQGEAQQIKAQKGYILKEDSGRGWRRVVPSPKPVDIIETEIVKQLVKLGDIVIAAGGGGVAIKRNKNGTYTGVDGVIDKDFAASLLAKEIGADILLTLTTVDNAMVNFGKPNQRALGRISIDEAEDYISNGQFGAGSMLPKIEAAIEFVKNTGGRSIITSLENARNAIEKDAGTIIQ